MWLAMLARVQAKSGSEGQPRKNGDSTDSTTACHPPAKILLPHKLKQLSARVFLLLLPSRILLKKLNQRA
jgi:hypothetical protein